jgi:glucose dehydrogenase
MAAARVALYRPLDFVGNGGIFRLSRAQCESHPLSHWGGNQMAKLKTALLASVTGAFCLATGLGSAGANESVIKGGQDPNEWAVYGKDYANTRFSPLKSINTGNVGTLKLAYSFQLGSLRSNEATPLVIGDTMYVSTSWGPKYVYALDAATGAQKWVYEPDIPDDVLQFACCDANSRGVAFADGKVFVGQERQGIVEGRRRRLYAGFGHHLAASRGQGQGHHRLWRRRVRRARLPASL